MIKNINKNNIFLLIRIIIKYKVICKNWNKILLWLIEKNIFIY